MERVSRQHARRPHALVSSRRALLGLALLAVGAACGTPSTAAPTTTTGQAIPAATPTATATATRASTATPASAVAFPQLAPVAGERATLTALLEGPLALVDGCLRVTLFGTSALIIWPPEVALRADGDDVQVVDAGGRVVARVGEEVRLSGGQIASVEGMGLREAPPAHCPGPYWHTGHILGPKPAPTATLTRPPGVAFPQLAPGASVQLERAALLEGPLVLVDGCLRVTGFGDTTSYLVVWPADVALGTDGDRVQVVFPGGRVAARVGEPVALQRFAGNPDQPLHEVLPAHCPGPYWVTGRVLAPAPEATPTAATP